MPTVLPTLHSVLACKINPKAITWVYRNGIKALPWFTHVREKLEDPASWGWFMANAGCNPVRQRGGRLLLYTH